jgi:thiamine monophosphate kinase
MGEERYRFGNVQGPVQTGDGVQYTAGRDQYVAGRDQVIAQGQAGEVLAELSSLGEALAGLRLTQAERSSADQDLQAMRDAVDRPDPDKGAASRHLQSFTTGLKDAGALATAGVTLAESIAKIAHWLGPLGAAVLALL